MKKAQPPKSKTDLIEEALARELLFRTDRASTYWLPSVLTLAKRHHTAATIVREAVNRLRAIGLVEVSHAAPLSSPPLQIATTYPSIALALRCAETPEQRQLALRRYCSAFRFVMAEAVTRCTGTEERLADVKGAVRSVVLSAHAGGRPEETSEAIARLAWVAGRDCGFEALHFAANSLEHAYPHAAPWLIAACAERIGFEAWSPVVNLIGTGSRAEFTAALTPCLIPLHQRAIELALHPVAEIPAVRLD